MRTFMLASTAIALALSCAPAPPSQLAVETRDNLFEPARAEIATGGRVTLVNRGTNHHLVASSIFDSRPLAPGQRFEFTFSQSGKYQIACDVHSGMAMVLEVRDVRR